MLLTINMGLSIEISVIIVLPKVWSCRESVTVLKILKLGYSIFKPIQNSAARFFGKFLLIPETLASHELGR